MSLTGECLEGPPAEMVKDKKHLEMVSDMLYNVTERINEYVTLIKQSTNRLHGNEAEADSECGDKRTEPNSAFMLLDMRLLDLEHAVNNLEYQSGRLDKIV